MRELLDHKIDPFNTEHIFVKAEDDGLQEGTPPSKFYIFLKGHNQDGNKLPTLKFQDGPLRVDNPWGTTFHPPNGISNEVLLAIVIDRLEAIQKGDKATKDNASAVKFLRNALSALAKPYKELYKETRKEK